VKNKIIRTIILSLIFCLAFYLRTYKIDNPIADWHSWRQADTAAITRNFVKEGFTPLFPKFDALVALNTYKDKNVNRYFFAEFPLYNIITYPIYKYFGVNTIYHRLVSIINYYFSLPSCQKLFIQIYCISILPYFCHPTL